ETSTSRSPSTAATADEEAPIDPDVDTARSKLCMSCSRAEAMSVSTFPKAMSATATMPTDHAMMPASAVRSNVQEDRIPTATAKLGTARGSTKPIAAGGPSTTAISAVLNKNQRPHIA